MTRDYRSASFGQGQITSTYHLEVVRVQIENSKTWRSLDIVHDYGGL
jgi:hypothetical protein